MTWNDYYINIAKTVAQKSKDPSSKVGCVIVDRNNEPVSFGFNGFVRKSKEDLMTFERPLKYNLTIHAEMNALIFAKQDLSGCKAYITHGPCDNCLKHLLQAGVTEIFYGCPGIIRDRGTEKEKEAIERLILSTEVKVQNVNNMNNYIQELQGRTNEQ